MPETRKFGSVAKAADQYDAFMKRYGGAYEGTTTLPDQETRTRAFEQAVTASSLKDEAMVHNVLNECASHYISSEDPREQNKNITAFRRILRYAQEKGLLAKAEPEQILNKIIEQLDKASGRATGHTTIDEPKVKILIKMGKAVCDAASLTEGPNVEFIRGMEEVMQQLTKEKGAKTKAPPKTRQTGHSKPERSR